MVSFIVIPFGINQSPDKSTPKEIIKIAETIVKSKKKKGKKNERKKRKRYSPKAATNKNKKLEKNGTKGIKCNN